MQSYLDVDQVTIAYPRGSIVTEAVRGVTFGLKRQEFVEMDGVWHSISVRSPVSDTPA